MKRIHPANKAVNNRWLSPKLMISPIRVVIFVSIAVAMLVIMCTSSPGQQAQVNQFGEDFEKTVERIRAKARFAHIGFHELEQYATPLAAGKKDAKAIEYLNTIAVTEEGTVARKLALLVLAKLTDHEVALQTLLEVASSPDLGSRNSVIVAASFLPADKARAFANSLLKNAPDVETQAKAVNLLGVVGNDETLDMLKKQAGDEHNTYVQQALERTIAELEFRASIRNNEERARWDAEQVIYWQAARDMPQMVTVEISVFAAADILAEQGVEFSASFLRYHIRCGESLATAIAANQKELVLSDDIKRQIMFSGNLGQIACIAIVKMCPEDAPRIFEEALAPDNRIQESNRRMARFLAQYGDEKTLEFLEKAKKNSSDYSVESRNAFTDASDRLLVRIEEEKKRNQRTQNQVDEGKLPGPRGVSGPGVFIPN